MTWYLGEHETAHMEHEPGESWCGAAMRTELGEASPVVNRCLHCHSMARKASGMPLLERIYRRRGPTADEVSAAVRRYQERGGQIKRLPDAVPATPTAYAANPTAERHWSPGGMYAL